MIAGSRCYWKVANMRGASLIFACILCTSQVFLVTASDEASKYTKEQLTFANKPLEKSPKLEANSTEHFPVRNVDDLNGLDDTELGQIFQKGVADVPSSLESERGESTMSALSAVIRSFFSVALQHLHPQFFTG
jgi:hypothetical protein